MKSNVTKRFDFKRLTHGWSKTVTSVIGQIKFKDHLPVIEKRLCKAFCCSWKLHWEKKKHCLKDRLCSQGTGPKFVWVRDVASISIRFTRNRSCTGSHRKKEMNRRNELACECRRISGCRFSPPKNNVCEPEPQTHFRDLTPDAR